MARRANVSSSNYERVLIIAPGASFLQRVIEKRRGRKTLSKHVWCDNSCIYNTDSKDDELQVLMIILS